MAQTFTATEITVGYHPAGYRIDKTASPLNIYTKWEITAAGQWTNPQPVCFDSLPQEGWYKINGFDLNDTSSEVRKT